MLLPATPILLKIAATALGLLALLVGLCLVDFSSHGPDRFGDG